MAKGAAKGVAIGAKLAWVPVVGPGIAVATGFIGGMVGYFGGSKLGESIYNTGKKVAAAAKVVAKPAVDILKTAKDKAVEKVSNVWNKAKGAVASLFGF